MQFVQDDKPYYRASVLQPEVGTLFTITQNNEAPTMQPGFNPIHSNRPYPDASAMKPGLTIIRPPAPNTESPAPQPRLNIKQPPRASANQPGLLKFQYPYSNIGLMGHGIMDDTQVKDYFNVEKHVSSYSMVSNPDQEQS